MKYLTLSIAFVAATLSLKAQSKIGEIEQKVTDSICACMSKTDMAKVKTKDEASAVFTNCFMKQSKLLIPLAGERKVQITDNAAMRQIGLDVGKNLLNQGCESFLKLSMVMAKDKIDKIDIDGTGTTKGSLKRIDTKDFNYLVITDEAGKEKSFIWLRQFEGADLLSGNAASFIGKKVTIAWEEREAYIPSAKSYFQLKEIVKVAVE